MKTKKPGKQRKRIYQAPLHNRGKLLSSPLSSDLKTRFKTNAAKVRRGDTVRVLRGDRKGFEGKVTRVERKSYRIFVEGMSRDKADGTATLIPIHPSKIMITDLNLDDKWRRKTLERKGAFLEAELREEKVAEKPEKVGETEESSEAKEVGGE